MPRLNVREIIQFSELLQQRAGEYYPFQSDYWPLFHGLSLLIQADPIATLAQLARKGDSPAEKAQDTSYVLGAIRHALSVISTEHERAIILERLECGLLATHARYAFTITRLFGPRSTIAFRSAYGHVLLSFLQAARLYRPYRNVPFVAFAKHYALAALRHLQTAPLSPTTDVAGVPVWIHEYLHLQMNP